MGRRDQLSGLVPLPAESAPEEALGRFLVVRGAGQEIDRLASTVDGPVQVTPAAPNPDGGLVDVPRPAAGAQVAAQPLLELGGEAPDSTVQADMVDLDAAVGQHSLEVAVTDAEPRVPPDHLEDDLGWEAEAAAGPGIGHGKRSRRG